LLEFDILDVFSEQNLLSPAEKNRLQEITRQLNCIWQQEELNLGKDQGNDTSEKTCGLSRWAAQKVEMGSTVDEEEEQAVAARGS
jgi:hypothetical protein